MASHTITRYPTHESTAPVRPSDLITDVGTPLFLAAAIRRADAFTLSAGNATDRVRAVLRRYEQMTQLHGLPGCRLWLQGTVPEWVESQFPGWTGCDFRRAQQELFRRGALVRACGDPRVLTALTTTHTAEVTH